MAGSFCTARRFESRQSSYQFKRRQPRQRMVRPSSGAPIPLNRQAATYAREGVEIDATTMADRVGACVVALDPLIQAIRAHVLTAERIHADDTTVPVLAKLKTRIGRIWVYLRDDRPFGGAIPPAAFFEYSRSRHGEYPTKHLEGWTGVMQADAFAGFNDLYDGRRKPGPIIEAACWAHSRRKFFELAKLTKSPIAMEAVRRIDELFEIERAINGKPPDERKTVRQDRSKPLVIALEAWLKEQRARLSPKHDLVKAINYSLNNWAAFTRFLNDGRICLSNNAAEIALRGVAVGRRNWTFAGSDCCPHRGAIKLISTHASLQKHEQLSAHNASGLSAMTAAGANAFERALK